MRRTVQHLPDKSFILLSYDDLRVMGIRYCREQLRRLERDRKFPRRLRFSSARIAWLQHEIFEWIDERAEERETREYRDDD